MAKRNETRIEERCAEIADFVRTHGHDRIPVRIEGRLNPPWPMVQPAPPPLAVREAVAGGHRLAGGGGPAAVALPRSRRRQIWASL